MMKKKRMLPGDVILEINGESMEQSTPDWSLPDVEEKLGLKYIYSSNDNQKVASVNMLHV